MVWKSNFNVEEESGVGLIYDLRQTYVQILDEVLKRIVECRVLENYTGLFNALEHLKIEINQKLTIPEREEYQRELKKCIKVLQDNSSVYNGTSKDPNSTFKIKCALKELEEWLRVKMEEHKLFGDKEVEQERL